MSRPRPSVALPCAALAAALALVGLPASPAAAHPHVWVTVRSELVYGAGGTVTAIRHHWTFDEAYSSFAMQGLDTNNDGKLSAEELLPLAKENTDNLAEFGYFTVLKVDGKRLDLNPATEPSMLSDGKTLTLSFLLPVKNAVPAKRTVYLDVYDPTFFVDFSYDDREGAVTLAGTPPAGCAVQITRPANKPDPATTKLSEDYFANFNMGIQYASKAFIACP